MRVSKAHQEIEKTESKHLEQTSKLHYSNFSAQDVAEHFDGKGFSEYSQCWIEHRIDGPIAVKLNPEDLKDIGITRVGDRKRIEQGLHELKQLALKAEKKRIIASHIEAYRGSKIREFFRDKVLGCVFPRSQNIYQLMGMSLKIRRHDKDACWGHEGKWNHHTIPLDKVIDVEVSQKSLGKGCFAKAHAHLSLTCEPDVGGHFHIYMDEKEGAKFAQEILKQKEVMERLLIEGA